MTNEMTTDTIHLQKPNGTKVVLYVERSRESNRVVIRRKEIWIGDKEGAVPMK